MKVRLELKTVQDLERALRDAGPSHRRDSLAILRKWRDEPGLEKDSQTQQLIGRLLSEYRSDLDPPPILPAPITPASNSPDPPSSAHSTPLGAPKVFISYTHHEDPFHKDWVRTLASDLRANGIDVILDQWDLPKGGDLTRFMEKGIRDSSRVLLVFTPAYRTKANERTGGVGYESLVVTGELAQNMDTTKFIGILRRGDWTDAVPTFMESRNHIDFRKDDNYKATFEELLRELHQSPANPKPLLGKNPFQAVPPSIPNSAQRYESYSPDRQTPAPAAATAAGDASKFVRDVTIPDGSYIKVGGEFEKIWEIQNVGSVVWRNRFLRREGASSGSALITSPEKVAIPETHPAQTVQISVPMKAPNIPTTTTAIWKMVDEHGNKCFPDRYRHGLTITINVIEM